LPVRVYLIDPVLDPREEPTATSGNDSADTIGVDAVVRVVQPEAPGQPVAWPLTHLLIRRWYGPDAVSPTIVAGIAGVVAARCDAGPSLREADRWVQGEISAGRQLALTALAAENPPHVLPVQEPGWALAVTSFVGCLIDLFGVAPLQALMGAGSPGRRDAAALKAYHMPYGSLEELWLSTLRRKMSGSVAFSALMSHLMPLLRPYNWQIA